MSKHRLFIKFIQPISPIKITLRSPTWTTFRQIARRKLKAQDNLLNMKPNAYKRLLEPIPEITKCLMLRIQSKENTISLR